MRTFYLAQDSKVLTTPSAATIGFFDGVHLGHRYLLDRMRDDARQKGLQTVVVTFDRHPRQVLQQDWRPALLTPLDEKLRQLATTGIDCCAVLPFSREWAALSAREFMQVLRDTLGVAELSIGYDHRFGHNREEGFDDYVAYGRQLGIDVVQGLPYCTGGLQVSSSAIRRMLGDGDVEGAAQGLGRDYSLSGTVVDGFQEGRKLGFPTANIEPLCAEQLVPKAGAYAAMVTLDDETTQRPAMMNIGTRPTYERQGQTIEVHILNFHGDVYGHRLTVNFVRRLRDEQRFDSTDALARQLHDDAQKALQLLTNKKKG